MTHGGQGLVIELDDIKLRVQIHLRKHAEQTAAGRVDQHGNFRPFVFQHFLIAPEALALAQIEGDRPDLRAAGAGKRFQPLAPSGDDPDFIENLVPVEGEDKLTAHAGRSTCDNGDSHSLLLIF